MQYKTPLSSNKASETHPTPPSYRHANLTAYGGSILFWACKNANAVPARVECRCLATMVRVLARHVRALAGSPCVVHALAVTLQSLASSVSMGDA